MKKIKNIIEETVSQTLIKENLGNFNTIRELVSNIPWRKLHFISGSDAIILNNKIQEIKQDLEFVKNKLENFLDIN